MPDEKSDRDAEFMKEEGEWKEDAKPVEDGDDNKINEGVQSLSEEIKGAPVEQIKEPHEIKSDTE